MLKLLSTAPAALLAAKALPAAVLASAALLALPVQAQHVYRCPGPDGRMMYTDKPCSSGERLRMNPKTIGAGFRREAPLRVRNSRTQRATATTTATTPAPQATDGTPAASGGGVQF